MGWPEGTGMGHGATLGGLCAVGVDGVGTRRTMVNLEKWLIVTLNGPLSVFEQARGRDAHGSWGRHGRWGCERGARGHVDKGRVADADTGGRCKGCVAEEAWSAWAVGATRTMGCERRARGQRWVTRTLVDEGCVVKERMGGGEIKDKQSAPNHCRVGRSLACAPARRMGCGGGPVRRGAGVRGARAAEIEPRLRAFEVIRTP